MKKTFTLASLAIITLLSGCNMSGAEKETAQTETLMDQISVAVGIPAIQNFTEKRQLKMLYELRDRSNLVTYSYFVDMAGKLHKICPTTSIGYGMPFSAQYTAPQVTNINGRTRYQPEPNGLYMPDSTTATWVICSSKNGELNPVYVEPQIIVSLTPMEN